MRRGMPVIAAMCFQDSFRAWTWCSAATLAHDIILYFLSVMHSERRVTWEP
jgi:hypothetical protein